MVDKPKTWRAVLTIEFDDEKAARSTVRRLLEEEGGEVSLLKITPPTEDSKYDVRVQQ